MPVRRTSVAFFAGLLVLGSVLAQAAPPFPFLNTNKEAPAPAVHWQHDLPTAYKLANEQHKPMLIVFGAEWCHFCKKLEKETLGAAEVANFVNDAFIPVHLDADKEKRAVDILQVSGLPCSVVISPDAMLLSRIEGFRKADEFQKQLLAARQKHQLAQQTAAGAAVLK